MDDFDAIERDINRRANRKYYAKRSRMEPLGYCDVAPRFIKPIKTASPTDNVGNVLLDRFNLEVLDK